ncbi:dethiobiotin synthase [Crocinitomicaceae bacterium]|nr:dethiobiotin synthase [Crocinitomicaceae bacterium]
MNKHHQYFISGIGTDVGKTIVSAIVSEALEATYWKPIQAGDLVNSDSIKIKNLTENVTVLKEGVKLSQAMSPHAAARIDGVKLGVLDFSLPKIDGNFIVEGAGGLMVPLNSDGLMIADIIEEFKLPVIIVSRHYLGSINHTLLTVEVLKNRGVVIKGIVFVGQENRDTEEIILSTTGLKMIARIPEVNVITKEFIKEQANLFSLD